MELNDTGERQTLLINGHEIYIEKFGSNHNPLVILLHHGLGSGKAWQKQIQILLENGFAVWVYDRWGYGNSSDRMELDPPWFEADVADVYELLKESSDKVILIGHSDGGNIALSFTIKYPKKVLGAIIIAAHIYVEPKMIDGMMALQRAFQNQESFRRGLAKVHGKKMVFERWWRAWTELEPNWDMREKLSQIRCPVLVIQGGQDEHATTQHAIDCAQAIPHGQVWILAEAKHMLPQENAEEFNPKMIEFLKFLLEKEQINV